VLIRTEPPNAARLPTPPTEAPPTPQRTFQNVNHIAALLKRKVADDEKYEKERLRKRQKRQQGSAAAAAEAAPVLSLPPPDKMTKKDKDALKKQNQTEDVLHRKANETASMALGFGKKKKYAWMTGGPSGGGGAGGASGAATPKPSASTGTSGAATQRPLSTKRSKAGRETSGPTLKTLRSERESKCAI
jgi:hypothetical protein